MRSNRINKYIVLAASSVALLSVEALAAESLSLDKASCDGAICSYSGSGSEVMKGSMFGNVFGEQLHPLSNGDIVNKQIASWTDPFTLPQIRGRCVKWASGRWPWGGGWKTCVGAAVDHKVMMVTANLVITGPGNLADAAKKAVVNCSTVASGAALGMFVGTPSPEVAARVAAAYTTFLGTFTGCLKTVGVASLGISVSLPTSSHWSNWSGGPA